MVLSAMANMLNEYFVNIAQELKQSQTSSVSFDSSKLEEFVSSIIDNFFTITAEIHARSLAYFYGQYADRHMNLKFMGRVSERERAIRQFVTVKKN